MLAPYSTLSKDIADLQIRRGLDGLTPARIVTLFRRGPLQREVTDPAAIWKSYENSTLVLTAWLNGQLVGLARVLTDGELFSFLCDLVVEPDVQRIGVGKAMVQAVVEACKGTELMLRDAEISAGFYQHLGFTRVTNGWARMCR
ncbi:MAG: GNAT family N-acetyltransferase [Rhodothermales bacterium]